MKKNRLVQALFIFLTITLFASVIWAAPGPVTLAVTAGEGTIGDIVELDVAVDNSSDIAGAVFTMSYDQAVFELQGLESNFFRTFEEQWAMIDPLRDPLPDLDVTIDGTKYTKAFVANSLPGKIMVAGANYAKNIGLGKSIVSFQFKILAGATPLAANDDFRIYNINLTKSIIGNVSAGYPEGGDEIPVFISYDNTQEDPAQMYPEVPVTNNFPVQGAVKVLFQAPRDSDQDGILDSWEITNYGDLTRGKAEYAMMDSDKDGFSDLDEYYNGTGIDVPDDIVNAYLVLMNDVSYTLESGSHTEVYGSAEKNHLVIESGAMAKCLTFSGENAIVFASASGIFSVSRDGSTVTLQGVDGTQLILPASTTPQTIIFSDGAADLFIENGSVKLGDQVILSDGEPLNTVLRNVPEIIENPTGSLENPDAYLLLSDEVAYGLRSISNTVVYGSPGNNSFRLESGASVKFLSSPGENTIIIEANAALFNVSRSGSVVTLNGSDGTLLILPATTAPQTIQFNDRSLMLLIADGEVLLEAQVVENIATSVE